MVYYHITSNYESFALNFVEYESNTWIWMRTGDMCVCLYPNNRTLWMEMKTVFNNSQQ